LFKGVLLAAGNWLLENFCRSESWPSDKYTLTINDIFTVMVDSQQFQLNDS